MIGRPSSGSTLSSRLDEREMTEIRDAVAALLKRPLLSAEENPTDFPKVRRHETRLREWFAEELGYRLVVDSGFARLLKVPPPVPGANRFLSTRSGTPFQPLHYTLLCLVLAVLERSGDQTTLGNLAGDVRLRAPEIDGLALDFDRAAHRRAFVHSVRALVDLTVLRHLDGDEERFARGDENGDALYRVDHRRRAQILSCPVSPSTAGSLADLTREAYADTTEGRSRRHRHRIMRMLVEEPVLYFADLDEDEQGYLRLQRARIEDRLDRFCGLETEVRKEGIVAVDTSGRTGIGAFPAPGTVPHAALLLAEHLAARGRGRGEAGIVPMSETEAANVLSELAAEHGGGWRADTKEDAGTERLATEALDLLAAFRLVARREGGVVPLPAVARFASIRAGDRPEEEEEDGR